MSSNKLQWAIFVSGMTAGAFINVWTPFITTFAPLATTVILGLLVFVIIGSAAWDTK